MGKIFEVYLGRNDDPDSEASATLLLPATPYEILDALDKLRLTTPNDFYMEICEYRNFEYLESFLEESSSLYELNALAHQLTELGEWQLAIFEGLVKMDTAKKAGQIQMSRLLDLAYSTYCAHVVPEARNDSQFGRFYAENGFVPEVENLPDKIFDLLDFERIGREQRLAEGGVYSSQGYVVQHTDLQTAPPEIAELPQKPDYQILLQLTKSGEPKSVLLALPASNLKIEETLDSLQAASITDCTYQCVDCRAPALMELLNEAQDFTLLDTFTTLLADMDDNLLVRYKAMLAQIQPKSMEHAQELMKYMDCFMLDPGISSPREMAQAELRFMLGSNDVETLLQYTNLYDYGRALLKRDNSEISPYGLLERRDGQPIQAPLKELPEMEPTVFTEDTLQPRGMRME